MTTFRKALGPVSRLRLKILWIISFLLSCDGQQTHFLTQYSTEPQYAVLGSNFTFKWTYMLAGQDTLDSISVDFSFWSKLLIYVRPNGTVYVNSINSKYKGRITWTGDLATSVASFVLSNVTLGDETMYSIKIAYNSSLTVQNEVNIKVLVPARFTVPPPLKKNVQEGKDLTLPCEAYGKPEPIITWVQVLINAPIVIQEGQTCSTLTITNISRHGETESSYVYECQVVNIPGRGPIKKQTMVTVYYAPEGTTLTTSAVSDTAVKGDSVTFTCGIADAKPAVDKYEFSVKKDGWTNFPGSEQKTRQLSSVKGSDQGTYKCVPHNAVGDGKEATVKLTVNVPPKITSILGDKTVKEGDPFDLTCAADGQPAPTITWTKGWTQLSQNKRFKVLASNRNDTGEYICTAENLLSKDTSSVHVTVQLPPKITSISGNKTVKEGDNFDLTCGADGQPAPTITWTKGGTQLSQNKTFKVLASNRNDAGEYICTAENLLSKDTSSVHVTVQYKAKIDKAASSSNLASWIGQNVSLTCVTDGVPVPSLTWTKPGGSQLKPETSKTSRVNLDLTTGADFGEYKCSAENGFPPADILTIRLDQIMEPGSPIDPFCNEDIQASSLTIRLIPPSTNGGSPVIGYRVRVLGTEFNKNYSSTVRKSVIEPLIRNTSYTLEVYAKNVAGEGLPVKKIFSTKYEGAPDAVEITISSTEDPRTFEVRWTEPINNGAAITSYKIYKRVVGTKEWDVHTLSKDTLSYNISLYPSTSYEIIVTATNEFGESVKGNGRKIDVHEANIEGGTCPSESCSCGKVHTAYGVIIAILVFIIVAQFLFICWRKEGKKKRRSLKRCVCGGRERRMDPTLSTNDSVVGAYANPSVTNSGAQTPAAPSTYMPLVSFTRSWELKRSNINVMENIGKGAFSKICKATATGIPGVKGEVTVAVKILKENATTSDREDLLAELELMKTFDHHPHVIKLVGCVTESEPPMVIIEYFPYGDLLGYLRNRRGVNDTYYKNPDINPRTNVTSKQLTRFAWQIADGMNYLASQKVIHHDLAARNVLVGEGEKCKVTGFGMAPYVLQGDKYTKRSQSRLPVKWTAYESLLYGVYTNQSDVWSYGIVLYEIFTIGGRPYPNIDCRRIAARLQEGYRMPKPSHLENRLYCIMTDCWKENPSERPTFSELKDLMNKMEKDHRTYINLRKYDGSLYANVDELGGV